jgi:hypothetical protein
MTPTKFAELCESIGLERDNNIPWPGPGEDPCLYNVPKSLGFVFRNSSNCVTSHSNTYGYRICLIEDGDKSLGGWLNNDEEIYERAYELQKQIKDLRIKQNLESIKRDFK